MHIFEILVPAGPSPMTRRKIRNAYSYGLDGICTLHAAQSADDDFYIKHTLSLQVSLNSGRQFPAAYVKLAVFGHCLCSWLSTHLPRVVQSLNKCQQIKPVKIWTPRLACSRKEPSANRAPLRVAGVVSHASFATPDES